MFRSGRGWEGECQVQLKHVHARLTEEPHLPRSDVFRHQATHLIVWHMPFPRYTWHLEIGCGRGDIRVEPGRGRCNKIDRNWGGRILCFECCCVLLHAVNKLLVCGPQISACRLRRVVSMTGSGRPGMEVS